jgi:hypothetical protein
MISLNICCFIFLIKIIFFKLGDIIKFAANKFADYNINLNSYLFTNITP